MQNATAEYNEKLWHTSAHIFANALTDLFPKAKIAIGPPIEMGFHYDFDLEQSLTAEDVAKIEERMREILKRKENVVRGELTIAQALAVFKDNPYKVEMINDLAKDGATTISTYTNGPFMDMCKGPHVTNTSEIGAVKLLKNSAAYWKGSDKNKMLQRVYGIGFKTQQELDTWVELRKKAEDNSNVKLGKELDLYMISDLVGRGLPIWTPNGTIIRMQLQEWLIKEQQKRGYNFVITPHITRAELFKQSGHLGHYRDSMYAPMKIDDEEYFLKPMNCPFHIQYYANAMKSYRELPLRIAEMGTVYRYEQSGELSGLLRVRGFTQDDAHIFCTPEQVQGEFRDVFMLITKIMTTLKLKDFRIRIGARDDSDKYIGDKTVWEKATNEIAEVLDEQKIPYTINPGDAAFYGPKADIVIKDGLGREWQIGTIQLDYNLPEKFGLEYIGADGQKHRPVMIHRAPFGSFERFTGILIEHFGGAFPTWLSPTQVKIVPISEKFNAYARKVHEALTTIDVRSKLDDRNETLGYRIREAQKQKVPYIIVIGGKEETDGTVAIRPRVGEQRVQKLEEFITAISQEIKEKA